MAKVTMELSIACALVTLGGIIGVTPWHAFYQRLLTKIKPRQHLQRKPYKAI
jgi:hypothetical protein